ncbi:hypothetical protein ACFL2T_04855 [Elusimicrobiota bacterium]
MAKFLNIKREMDTAANHARNLQTSLEDLAYRAKRVFRAQKTGKPVYDRTFADDLAAVRKMTRSFVQIASSIQPRARSAMRAVGASVPESDRRMLEASARKLKKCAQEATESARSVSHYCLSPSDKSTATYVITDLERLHVGGIGGGGEQTQQSSFDND